MSNIGNLTPNTLPEAGAHPEFSIGGTGGLTLMLCII